jgi:hypothetical protein
MSDVNHTNAQPEDGESPEAIKAQLRLQAVNPSDPEAIIHAVRQAFEDAVRRGVMSRESADQSIERAAAALIRARISAIGEIDSASKPRADLNQRVREETAGPLAQLNIDLSSTKVTRAADGAVEARDVKRIVNLRIDISGILDTVSVMWDAVAGIGTQICAWCVKAVVKVRQRQLEAARKGDGRGDDDDHPGI